MHQSTPENQFDATSKMGGAFTSIVLSLIIGAGTGILGIVEVGVGVVIIVDRFAAGARCALPSSSVDLA